MSLTCINQSGISTDPCGTPLVTFTHQELLPCIKNHMLLYAIDKVSYPCEKVTTDMHCKILGYLSVLNVEQSRRP